MPAVKGSSRLRSPLEFSEALYQRLIPINPGIGKLALYEFRYAIEELYPREGWESVQLESPEAIAEKISRRDFYESVQLKPRQKDRIVLDEGITRLTRMLFVGLVKEYYPPDWVNSLFYFDIRGFIFIPRTVYFTPAGLAHLGGKPFLSLENSQKRFDEAQDIGYLEFMQANTGIDGTFVDLVKKLIGSLGTPILVTIAGPTAAGKTEITERLIEAFDKLGHASTTIEMDNFLYDRDYRDKKPMGTGTIHFELFKRCLQNLLQGRTTSIPFYDSIAAISSHDLEGNLRPGYSPLTIEPADIIFLEGNFPFHIQEISDLIGIKVVYLTDDPIRLKRKWKRDIDYRKNYDPAHFRNRYFSMQFLRAEDVYRPQIEKCDMLVDTTHAAIWVTPKIAGLLQEK